MTLPPFDLDAPYRPPTASFDGLPEVEIALPERSESARTETTRLRANLTALAGGLPAEFRTLQTALLALEAGLGRS